MVKLDKIDNKKIVSIEPLSGGCIGKSYRIDTEKSSFFYKEYNIKGVSTGESNSLKELLKADTIRVPKVIMVDENFILLEYIEEGSKNSSFYRELGSKLAKLHKKSNRLYGLDYNNFIGQTTQINTPEESWINFFINKRLNYQLKLAKAKGYSELENYLFKMVKNIPDIIKPSLEEPSLIHGDLWGGNIMADKQGEPVIFDPATYYGHREAEIAMTKLFGGFSKEFYNSYNMEYPLKKGWQKRLDLYNLYHLLNHLNLFGSSYYSQCLSVIKSYI